MRNSIRLFTILLSTLLVIGVCASRLDAAIPRPARLRSRQASRESVVARALAVSRGIRKRQNNPSARPTVCGTLSYTNYLIRATSIDTNGFPVSAPGYLTSGPTDTWSNLLVTSNMQDASFYTLDPDTGCGIRDVSNGGLLVWAAPGSAQGGSVTYAGTDDELATWNGDGVRWECSAAAGGVLSCTMSGNNINTPYYGLQRPDGSTTAQVATCYAGGNCFQGPETYLTFELIAV